MTAVGHPAAAGWLDGRPVLPAVHVAFLPGELTDLLGEFEERLREEFVRQGHVVQDAPDENTDLVLTSGPFARPLSWRRAVIFRLRPKFGVRHDPVVYSLVHATSAEFRALLDQLEVALKPDDPDPEDFRMQGLSDTAHRVLHEQGRRGGPILALERAVQAQVKSIRVLLVVGDEQPARVFHFDLVGAHPQSTGTPAEIATDVVLRMVTTVSTEDVAEHEATVELVPRAMWDGLTTPKAMSAASGELNERGFFTDPVVIADLVKVPAVSKAVADHYSEGCFGTWEPELGGLVTTVTGSIRPVHKGHVTTHDLAVIVGLRPNGMGAFFRPIEGLESTPPSSEGVELMGMDQLLPRIGLSDSWDTEGEVPVLRSKLHGHRGIGSFDPERVEFVPLDPPYYDYLVSCASDAQAMGVKEAFSRSLALRDPADPRTVVFTVLPGHGVMIAEKWVEDQAPFEEIWQAMDLGALNVTSEVPQGRLTFIEDRGQMVLEEETPSIL
ncbi:MAG: hypothetical protein ACE5MI_12870 [Acidimicrobiia bacterium]